MTWYNPILLLQKVIGGAKPEPVPERPLDPSTIISFDREIEKLKQNHRSYTDFRLNNYILRYTSRIDVNQCVSKLANALRDNTTLSRLHLQGCLINDENAIEIAKALKTQNRIQYIDLGRNLIGDEGLKALCESFQYCACIKSLRADENKFGETGMKYIADLLSREKKDLLKLVLETQIGPEGANHYSRHVSSTLTELSLSLNPIGDEGVEILAKAMEGNSTLNMLELTDTNMTAKGAVSILTSLKGNRRLTMLNMSKNKINDRGAYSIAAVLSKSKNALLCLVLNDSGISERGKGCLTASSSFMITV